MASERIQQVIDGLLDEAVEAISRSDWATVRDRALNVLALDPDNSDAHAFIAAADRASVDSAPQSDSQPASPAPTTPNPAADQPTSFANGRYQVKRFLGEGGKKKVYLAQDTLLDREVAFALLKTESLPSGKGLSQIFVSHVQEDSSTAIRLAEALEAKGYSTWYYERDSVPGPAYLTQMGDAIEQSQAVVLIISPQAVGSNQVTTEVVRAHEGNKAFIPLLSGISHVEFQARAPIWRQALGASTAIEISEERVEQVASRVVEGLEALGIGSADRGSEADRTRINREAQSMGRLGTHPNIVIVFDLGQHEGQPYMVTEFMSGGDVEGTMQAAPDHRLPLELTINIAKEVCRGLEFAHDAGIVHRDLKPGNVWLTSTGTAKIGDFGLAVAADQSRLTKEGMMVGTVSYMPPEQAMGGAVSPQSDLYSLGTMLYEMVTGRPPFLGDDSVAIIGQHINTPPVAPTWHNSECPRQLESLILRLLAKDPGERPESASDVLTALQNIGLTTTTEDVELLADEAHSLDSLAGGVFVGRQREMGELKAALEDALSGRGRLLTLVGEPGIGKTRTAQELATYAGLRGAQVLWGRCYEEQGMPPYWPWVQAIRSYVRERDPEQLHSEMGSGAADIAEVVSDVRERLPDLGKPPTLEPEQARFRLFDSISAFLKTASQRRPLVLVLDDLHWADRPSLLLLEFVARELVGGRLLVIGTYRDVEVVRGHPLSQTLGELTRERLFQRVQLRGLSQDDVGRFIEIVSGIPPVRGMVEAVYRQTEGNPLFVTEVVRLLAQEGELTPDLSAQRESWSVRIPEGVREVIGRRLDRLSERCNLTLTVASVIGREFTLDQMNRLIDDLSEDRLLEVLEEGLAARVIEELPRAVGRYQFTHALIQETLAEELSSTRRARLHVRIGEVLEELYGPDVSGHAAELAHHFAEAEGVTGREKLVRYSLLAGDRALAAYAWEEAQFHYERGLAARGISLAGAEPAPDEESAALLFGRSRAQGATDQVREAWDALSRAFDYYAAAGDVVNAVAVAEYPLLFVSSFRGAAQLLERALELVAPDSHDAGRLFSRHGLLLNLEVGDYNRAREAFDRAMAIAEREGDAGLEMHTLANAADADWYQLRGEEVLEKSRRAIDLARSRNDPHAEIWPRFLAAFEELARGDLQGAGEHAAEMLAQAEKLKDRSLLALACVANGNLRRLQGDWQTARDFNERGLNYQPSQPWLISHRALLEYEVGQVAQGDAYTERMIEVMRATPPGPVAEYHFPALLIPIRARITGNEQWFDIAEQAAQVVRSSTNPKPMVTILSVGHALIPIIQNDAEAAEQAYTEIDQQWRQVDVDSAIVIGMPLVQRVLGLLAATVNRLSASAEHFEDALTFCSKAGYRPELAWTCCDYADTLLQRNNPGDREKAMSLLDESLAISTELGMRPLMERVLSRREISKA